MNTEHNEDEDAWRQFTRSVARLPAKPVVAPASTSKPIVVSSCFRLLPPPARKGLAPLDIGASPDIDKGNAEKLKRGKHKIEGRLDLHGYSRMEAQQALRRFILSSYSQGKRCVLVVTGKGLKEDGSKGIIRSHVPIWLNEPDIRPYILAFRYAKVADGGEGALYVLLKRKP